MKVIHKRHMRLGDVYVGRPTRWGNPWTHKPEGTTLARFVVATREEAIGNYRQWLLGTAFQDVLPEQRRWIVEHLHSLRGRRLACWCAPKSCHAEVLAELANA